MTHINWFPGHMAKTINQLKQRLQGIDIIIELLDARIPFSSQNPIIKTFITSNHHHVIGLTKTDLADPHTTTQWIAHFKNITPHVFHLNIPKNKGVSELLKCCKTISQNKRQKKQFHITKVMICGIPNVGKSALLNKLAKKKAAAVQNKPGVTKSTQPIMLDKFVQLIDSPGLLWPKLDNKSVAQHLALTGAIKDIQFDTEELISSHLPYIIQHYADRLKNRYKLSESDFNEPSLLEPIAYGIKAMLEGDIPNTQKAALTLLQDIRSGRFGTISLERP